MVDSYILRSVAFSILLLLGACAGTPSPPETTALDTASTPVPEFQAAARALARRG